MESLNNNDKVARLNRPAVHVEDVVTSKQLGYRELDQASVFCSKMKSS